ncbi:PLP-dependent transferase [bacterium]|nr:PLP-dependent transferase [bacterium]
MDRTTEILHTRVNTSQAKSNVTPLYQCSSFLSDSDYFYTRKGNPNTTELEQVFQVLEGCRYARVVTTGMSAIYAALRLLKPGDHLIVDRLIYGCTYKLFKDFCQHFGIELDFIDVAGSALKQTMKSNTQMIFFETPTNPFLKSISISKVQQIARESQPSVRIVVDNTWATPFFQRPLELGADVCVYSATKFYSGHSDCMGGVLTTNHEDLAETIAQNRFYSGAILDPHSAWLIRRSMQTFSLRMEGHQAVLREMREFLEKQEEVAQIFYPEINSQLTGYGCILFFELTAEFEEKAERFMKSLRLFERGTSMASVVSAVAQPFSGSHLSLSCQEKAEMGIRPRLLRLCFGFEKPEDLKSDLKIAFRKLHE